MMQNYIKRILIFIPLSIGIATTSCAQNNPYKIKDKLYPLYIKAYNLRKTEKCVPVADSLLNASKRAGDRYGEINALCVLMQHEFHKENNLPSLEKAMNKLMGKAEEYKAMRFYDYAISLKTTYLARQHRYIEAFLYLEEQTRLAKRRGDIEGIGTLHRMVGVVEQFRGELSQAAHCYQEVIEEYKRNKTTRYISREYLALADCYRMMTDYKKMAESAQDALQYCITEEDKNNAYIYQAYACFMLGKDDEFIEKCKYLDTHRSKISNTYIIMNDALDICRKISKGQHAEAIKAINRIAEKSEEESYRLYMAYYERKGDLMKCATFMKKLMNARNIQKEQTFEFDSRSTDDIFTNQKLEKERQSIINENARLQLSNTNMEYMNSTLELGRRRDAVTLAQAEERRNALENDNQKMLQRQLTDSINAQSLIQQAKDREYDAERFILLIILAAAAVTTVMTLAHNFYKLKTNRKLYEANKKLDDTILQLATAKEKALESEKMKSLFVQNMSHEIRTPLNAIVGFSHILTDMGEDYTREEKSNMAKYITDNSDLLATLINDILDITCIESGEITIRKAKLYVNEVCRECIETVRHRLQEGVALHFNTDATDDFYTFSDQHRVSQVLINMLTNAEKNTVKGSITLDCSIKRKPGTVTFTVTDTGTGISKEKQKDIFKRYKKLNDIKPGAGLGLDICRSIATRLDGFIDIDPDYRDGARFWFSIPVER